MMGWICSRCETHNTQIDTECEVCGQARKGLAPIMARTVATTEAKRTGTPPLWKVAGCALALWMSWTFLHTLSGKPAPSGKGIFSVRSNKPNATFFYRSIGNTRWRYVDCSPQNKVSVDTGRYEVKIEGAGGQILLAPREVEILKGQDTLIDANLR